MSSIFEGVALDPASVVGIALLIAFFGIVLIYGLRQEPNGSGSGSQEHEGPKEQS